MQLVYYPLCTEAPRVQSIEAVALWQFVIATTVVFPKIAALHTRDALQNGEVSLAIVDGYLLDSAQGGEPINLGNFDEEELILLQPATPRTEADELCLSVSDAITSLFKISEQSRSACAIRDHGEAIQADYETATTTESTRQGSVIRFDGVPGPERGGRSGGVLRQQRLLASWTQSLPGEECLDRLGRPALRLRATGCSLCRGRAARAACRNLHRSSRRERS